MKDQAIPRSAGKQGSDQALLNALPMPAYLCDSRGWVVAYNTRAAELWGENLQLGKSDAALGVAVAPWLLASSMPWRHILGEPKLMEEVEVRIETAAGDMTRAFASVSALAGDDAGRAIFLKSFRTSLPGDIEDFFENGLMGMRTVAVDGTIWRANQAELDLLGYGLDEYVGHKLAEFDADGDRLSKMLDIARSGGSVDKQPARMIGSDGRIREVQISSRGCFHEGQFLYARCFTLDISAQEKLSRTTRIHDRLSQQQLLQALPVAIYTTDIEGRITFFNDAAADFAGRRPLLGEKWSVSPKLFHLDGTPLSHEECAIAIALREERPLLGEMAIAERIDGQRVTYAAYPAPLRDDEGSLIGAVNVVVDITSQQESERATNELNARLARRVNERTRGMEAAFMNMHRRERDFEFLVTNVIDYAIYMLDPQGVITNWNAGAERIKGYRDDEVIGTNFSRFYTEEDRAKGLPAVALATARREGHYLAEGWRVRKDGSRFWANVVIDPLIDRGTLVGFAKITRDVTERMEAEAALVESEYFARGVIDTALDGFAQLGEDDRITRWNPRASSMFGWSREEAFDQELATLIVADHDRKRFSEAIASGTGGARGAPQQFETVSRAGRRIVAELSISLLPTNDGYRTNIFIRDLSEKIQIEAQLRQAQKMEAVGQLTGGLAHDFNNLLQGIIGSLDLIERRVEDGKTTDVVRFVSGAMNSANRAAAMTHRLLAFSRRQPLDPHPVLANPLMVSLTNMLQQMLGPRITLGFELAPDLWPTLCDSNQLESAVLNLAINARDAMPNGGHLSVRTRNVDIDESGVGNRLKEISGQYICIEIVDTGIGMTADVIEHAFEPFFTTKAIGHGTGLGLSMVYGFTRQSKGYCDIHSVPGEGSVIALYMPRYIATEGEESREVAATAPVVVGKGELVLVVEDESVVREVVVEVLHQLGYKTMAAADAEAGLAVLSSSENIHLLISDIGLPDMDGRMLARNACEMRPSLKVLLMTGYASGTSSTGGVASGMELITKPFTVDALASRLREMLEEAPDQASS